MGLERIRGSMPSGAFWKRSWAAHISYISTLVKRNRGLGPRLPYMDVERRKGQGRASCGHVHKQGLGMIIFINKG